MTIDERLEALTHTVELIAGFQIKSQQIQAKNEQMMADLMESVTALSRIAHLA